MKRDVPCGSEPPAFPSFGWGRVLPPPLLEQGWREWYVSVRLGPILRVLTVGRFRERMILTLATTDAREEVSILEVDALDPDEIVRRNEGSLQAALLTEQDRMDPDKAARRARRHRPDMREVMP